MVAFVLRANEWSQTRENSVGETQGVKLENQNKTIWFGVQNGNLHNCSEKLPLRKNV